MSAPHCWTGAHTRIIDYYALVRGVAGTSLVPVFGTLFLFIKRLFSYLSQGPAVTGAPLGCLLRLPSPLSVERRAALSDAQSNALVGRLRRADRERRHWRRMVRPRGHHRRSAQGVLDAPSTGRRFHSGIDGIRFFVGETREKLIVILCPAFCSPTLATWSIM